MNLSKIYEGVLRSGKVFFGGKINPLKCVGGQIMTEFFEFSAAGLILWKIKYTLIKGMKIFMLLKFWW